MAETYRAIELQRIAQTFREATAIVERALEAPGPGEITMRHAWCGVNGIFDTQISRNAVDYVPITPPVTMGVEAVGHVAAVGDGVTAFKVGDPVGTVRFGGGYREAWTAPVDRFVPVPAADAEHLTLISTGVSAVVAIEAVAELRPGETVAVSAAAGGLGHILVQLAVRLGCKVVAICGGPQKAARLAALGAARVIDYKSEDVGAVLDAEFKDTIDVAFDTVSGPIFDAFLRNIAPRGRLVIAGVASDLDGTPDLVTAPRIGNALYYKGASVRGFMNARHSELWPAARTLLFDLLARNALTVWRDPTDFAGLEGVYSAVEHLISGRNSGKVVVRLAP